MQKKYSISVVIPTYNGLHLLQKNISSVISALQYVQCVYEIILCDDCSTDNTICYIQQNYPEIKIVPSNTNNGYASNCNRGIFTAQYDLVFLLNNDVLLLENYFEHQFQYFNLSNTFGVAGKIIAYDSNSLQDAAKYPSYSFGSIKGSINYEITTTVPSHFFIPTFMLSGANALIDRKKLLVLQGFDENFSPYYWEDTDLSIRAQRLGWQCYYEPKSICRHPASSTIKKVATLKKIKLISTRNKLILYKKHLPKWEWLFFITQFHCKAFFKLLLANTTNEKAFFLFRTLKKEIQKSKELFESTGSYKLHSLAEVKEKILTEIKDVEIRKF